MKRPGNWLRHRDTFDAELVDGLLVDLAGHTDSATAVTIASRPARGGHGRHVVMWRQADTERTAEGNTLAAALRRAVADATARSAATR